MANHASAKKRNRQIIARTEAARAFRSAVRTAVKKADVAIAEGSDDAATLVKAASSLLDRAATKNALPKKRASRLKSRLALRHQKALKG
ncbi:MAG: 30S ribosomal protein S20 [Myxococcota bacterium]